MEALKPYIPVRVTNMAGVDLSAYSFDWSLTFSVLLMNDRGRIYHRYGSGDGRDAEAMLSIDSFVATLAYGLQSHAAFGRAEPAAPKRDRFTVEDLPPMKRRLAKNKPSCIHCHTVGDMFREQAEEERRFRFDDVWRHPPADRLGIRLDRDDQTRIVEVLPGSPAAVAGVRAGEHLVVVNGGEVRTEADVRAALDPLSGDAASVAVELSASAPARGIEGGVASRPEVRPSSGTTTRRADAGSATVARRRVVLELPAGWRRGDALDLAWRSDMWHLRPNPGFGGAFLGSDEKKKLGLPADRFALRVNYLIDFGAHPEDGRNAKRAGLKKGDVVFGVDGRGDFLNERQFQAWWRLEQKPGRTAKLDVLSGGVRKTIELPVLP